MSQLFRRLQNALQVEKGQGLVEYALILVMVAVVVISILSIVGPSVSNIFSNIVDNLGGVAVAADEPELCQVYITGSGYPYYQVREYTDKEKGYFNIVDQYKTDPGYPTC